VIVDQVADHPVTDHGLDRTVLDWFVAQRSALATGLATLVTEVGSTLVMALMAGVAVLVLWWRSRTAEAVAIAVATAGAGLLVVGFKALYGRPRPPLEVRLALETNASLPSGHALASTVVLGMLAIVAVRLARRRALRLLAPPLAAALVLVIGVSRLYLGAHWFTDVLVGWLLGGAWLVLCAAVLVAWRTDPVPVIEERCQEIS
jgi:undecaprenyl-diphosphatase